MQGEKISAGQASFIAVKGEPEGTDALRARLIDKANWPRSVVANSAIETRLIGDVVVAFAGGADWSESDAGACVGQFDLFGSASRERPGANAAAAARQIAESVQPHPLDGNFGYLVIDRRSGVIQAVSDRFRSVPLFYANGPNVIVASDLRLVMASGLLERRLSNAAIYHFLNLSYVPTPYTMYEGVMKLPRASIATIAGQGATVRRYWELSYSESEDVCDTARAASALLKRAREAVEDVRPRDDTHWGTFLSGGTDSSSIAGLLSEKAGAPVNSFSIGFSESGYDELEFAGIAAKKFGLNAHTHVVTADESLAMLPDLLEAYDEPPGNASCLPTLACAQLARKAGLQLLIGGDGGDEIFGGNERYRKDAILQGFYQLPGPIKAVARLLASPLPLLDWNLTNRIANFVRRGSIPNPDRFYSDDSYASEYYQELLSPQFRKTVGVDDSLNLMREKYSRISAPSELHRLMELDLEMTIADNDIVKVSRAAKAAGLAVRFPYLNTSLVEYTATLPARSKVNGGEKRFLFKRAMQSVLPESILRKKKQGFGLPTAIWFRTHAGFRSLIDDVVCSPRALARNFFNESHIRDLVRRHQRGAWDHGSEIWRLLMLEMWIRRHIDPYGS